MNGNKNLNGFKDKEIKRNIELTNQLQKLMNINPDQNLIKTNDQIFSTIDEALEEKYKIPQYFDQDLSEGSNNYKLKLKNFVKKKLTKITEEIINYRKK